MIDIEIMQDASEIIHYDSTLTEKKTVNFA